MRNFLKFLCVPPAYKPKDKTPTLQGKLNSQPDFKEKKLTPQPSLISQLDAKSLTSQLFASLKNLNDSIKNFAQPGEKLAVFLLDNDACIDYLFWERFSNLWFCIRFSKYPEYEEKFKPMVEKLREENIKNDGFEDNAKIEQILGENQEFQKFRRSVCEPIAEIILSNLILMAQNKKIIILIASNRQFINAEGRKWF